MGVMRFQIHPGDLLPNWPEAYRAYIAGFDGRVFPTRIEIDGNMMVCRRQTSESGKLHVAWPIEGAGRPVISTATLPERDEPYLLALELARGRLAQLRDRQFAWETAGLQLPGQFAPLHRQAYRLFTQAVLHKDRPEQASELASQAIAQASFAADMLMQAYIQQRLAVRRRRSGQLPVSLGCDLGFCRPEPGWSEKFCQAFHLASVPIEWRHIEPNEGQYNWDVNDAQVQWCEDNRLLMRGGPLIDLSPEGLPNWLWQWERDFFNLQSFVCDFVETALTRYLSRIRQWEISARVNTGGALALNEENRLALVARTLEIARQVDEEGQYFIRIDQPWGDYQARGQHRLAPLQFVDALVRYGVGLTGVNLEIGVGFRPRGTASRDLLEFSRLLDQWSALGVPLHVTLAFPSSAERDPHVTSELEVEPPAWRSPWCETAQAEWIDQYVPLLMSKQAVAGVSWSHFTDAGPHYFPHAGLLRPDGTPKPALEEFVKYRRG